MDAMTRRGGALLALAVLACASDAPGREAICRVPYEAPALEGFLDRTPSDLRTLSLRAQPNLPRSVGWLAMALSSRVRGGAEPAAARSLASLLRHAAESDVLAALRELPGLEQAERAQRNRDSVFLLNRTLLALLPAWDVLRRTASPDAGDAEAVEAWLGRLVELGDVDTGLAASRGETADCRRAPGWFDSDCNSDHTLRNAVTLQWGLMRGDKERVHRGIAGYRDALARLRADGGMPGELGRGTRALWYTRQNLSTLVFMAETAAARGRDLYGVEVEGRSLHTAIGFFLDALDDPDRILADAAMNHLPGPRKDYRTQQLAFLRPRPDGRHFMAWIEPYVARFPAREEARRLARLADGRILGADRPLVDEFAGGNASCLGTAPAS